MDIVVTYCEPWSTPLRTSKHHYIERLAALGHRVLYVEMPFNPLSLLRRPREFFSDGKSRLCAGVRQVAPNIWAMTGLFPFPYHRGLGGIFDRNSFNAMNQRVFLPRLIEALTQLDFKQLIVLNYYPLVLPVLDELNPSRVIFHMVDEWQGLVGIPHSMADLTSGMLERADVTVVTSKFLLEKYQDKARDIFLLRHGTDLSLFSPVCNGSVEGDPRLTSLPGTKVGYYGALHKLDVDLVRDVALQRPLWSFVFIGPLQGGQGRPFTTVPLPDNVYFWDAWPWRELPGFLAGLNVFWMPFVRNELTHAMCPIKLFEVMSAGVPIVSTDLQETREVGGTFVAYAIDAASHLEALDNSMMKNNLREREARAEKVAGYDWDMRLKTFMKLLLGSDAVV